MKEKRKNKFYVCMPIILIYSIIPLGGVGGVFLLYFTSADVFSMRDLIWTMLGVTILMLLLYIYIIYLCAPAVKIDESGVSSSLLGVFLKKKLSWDEIVEIKKSSNYFAEWIYFSDFELKDKKMTRSVIKKTIAIVNQEGLIEAIKKYCPDRLKEFLNE